MEKQKVLKGILLWGTLLVMWAPLVYYNQAIFPAVTGKNFFFRLAVAILAVFLAIFILQRKKFNFFNNKLFLAFLLYLAVYLLAAIFAINPQMAFFSSFERMGGWLTLLYLGIFFLIVINVFESKDDWQKLFRSSLICSAFVAVYALIIYFGHNIPITWPKNGATLGNIDFLGAYLLLNIFLGLLLFYLDKNKNWRIAYGALLALNLIVLFINAARAGIVGLIFGLLVLAVFVFIKAEKKIKYSLIIGLVLLLMFGGLAYQQRSSSWVKATPFLSRFVNISLSDSSTIDRLRIWQLSWRAFQDHPVLGYGPENAVYAINKYYNPRFVEQWFDRAHNFIFDNLLAAGIIGLLSYLVIFGLAIWLLIKNLNRNYYLGAILISSLAGFLVSNLFNFDTLSTWLPLLVILAFIGHWIKKENSENSVPSAISNYDFAVIGIAIFALLLLSYHAAIKPAYAGYLGAWATAYAEQDPVKAVGYMDRAIGLGTYGNRELVMQLSEYAKKINESDKFTPDDKKKYFEISERYLLDYLKNDPSNVQARIFLALLYQSYASENSFYANESIRLMENSINDSPKRKEVYNILAQGYYLKGDYARAAEYLKTSLAVNNFNEDQYLNLINILSQQKEKEEMDKYAKELLTTVSKISPKGYQRLGQYYFNIGNIDEAERIVRDLAIPANPDYMQTRISLASIYESRGEYDRAISYIKEQIQNHPEWTDVLNKYIKYLEEKKSK